MATTEQLMKREQLVRLLRTPYAWPEGFVWDYKNPNKCAMGLTKEAGIIEKGTPFFIHEIFGIERERGREIFMFMSHSTTPYQMADAIDRYTAKENELEKETN